ncbi:MAG: hypothetical protein IRZ16_04385 [Myxococcaceae bacterium]|nr:hypothetical protein [Myxococcaceae bacterium]
MTSPLWQAVRGALALTMLLLLAACGGNKDVKKDQPAAGAGDQSEGEQLAENIRQARQGNEEVTEYDLNHDKRPDVWSYTVKAKDEQGRTFDKLIRKELDINWDGKVDITRNYDDNEQVAREALDLDFDGKVDQVNFYEKGQIVRKERDLDYNGKPDLWLYFEKGKIVRKERDTDSNSKVDYWEYWEGDRVDRVGEDLDGDGTVDRWTKNPSSSEE